MLRFSPEPLAVAAKSGKLSWSIASGQIDCLVGWLVGWSVGRLVRWLIDSYSRFVFFCDAVNNSHAKVDIPTDRPRFLGPIQ